MKLTVLGGAGGWPPARGACSGYLIEHDGFRLLVDPGYAIVPRLLEIVPAEAIDAVLASHGHPDHVADLNPLLRARMMSDRSPQRLPAYALPDALGPVLALDQIKSLKNACEVREFEAGEAFPLGPFEIESRLLPHSVPNAGLRISVGGLSVTYTGDAGPSDDLVELAGGTDLLLAEATYAESVPSGNASVLNSALEVGRQAHRAGAARLMLTHLLPGTDPEASRIAAGRHFLERIDVAIGGVVVELSPTWQIRELAPSEVERVGAVLGLARLGQGDGYYLVAWEDDEPLGHAHLALTDPPELQDVSVRPEHRRRGVATALSGAAERAVVARGSARLRLSVSVDNAAAQALYRHLGYGDVGLPPRRVHGTVRIRTGTLEVDDTLLIREKSLEGMRPGS